MMGIVCFFIHQTSIAQTASIDGTVKNEDGEPMPGMTLTLRGMATTITKGAIANKQGKFRLTEVPLGTYTLTASGLGFKEQTREVSVNASLETSVDFVFTQASVAVNVSYIKSLYNEDLLEHRNANAFAPDSAGRPIPNLVLMRVFQRKRTFVNDNLSTFFTINLATGPLDHKIVVGLFATETAVGWCAFRGCGLPQCHEHGNNCHLQSCPAKPIFAGCTRSPRTECAKF